ncbi:MAG: Phage shock protein C [Candidatus Erwinia impunctatus]|nr:Phage shock protein C [Culicoides impunctatus]
MNTDVIRTQKLYRIPSQGKVKGVCAGLAAYLGIPVTVIRVITVLLLFLGMFVFTIITYFVLAFFLEELPEEAVRNRSSVLNTQQLLNKAQSDLADAEARLRNLERYVTSDTFSVRSRFSQL